MAENSAIEWTDNTANFWWGCFKVSDGCKNCYADSIAKWRGKDIWGPVKTSSREYKKGIWQELPKWNERAKENGRREKVFVMSMGDFFEDHPQVTEWRDRALVLIQECHYLDFQILTKRPKNVVRMIETSNSHSFSDAEMWFYAHPHVWIGTSVENQEQADKRIPELLQVPAAVRFLSCEPLLGPVDISLHLANNCLFKAERHCKILHNAQSNNGRRGWHGGSDGSNYWAECEICGEIFLDGSSVHWVIVGGESGTGKRPFNADWARSIRDQCQAAGVPFFMKQVDKVQPIPDDLMIRQFPQMEYINQ